MSFGVQPLDVVHQYVSNLQRKQRNLVKRKCKLDHYRDLLSKGEVLNEEQRKAVEGYEGVTHSIVLIQEVLTQSKELVDDVQKAVHDGEAQQELVCEKHTLSFLHTHVCLMRLMASLDNPEVRTAIAKASSPNHLKMLDVVNSLLSGPLLPDWPGINAVSLAGVSEFLQNKPEVCASAQYLYNFVTGRPLPIPVPEDYDGSQKKFNFKEARILCSRLLATPSVQRSLGLTNQTTSTTLVAEEAKSQSDPLCTHDLRDHHDFDQRLEDTDHHSEHRSSVTVNVQDETVDPTLQTQVHPAPDLSQVIKPLGGTFNFLQASNVMTPDPLAQLPPTVGTGATYNERFSPVASSSADIGLVEQIHSIPDEHDSPRHNIDTIYPINPDDVGVTPPPPHQPTIVNAPVIPDIESEPHISNSKPVSYADLFRRPGRAVPSNIQPQNEQPLRSIANEPRKSERVPVTATTGAGDTKVDAFIDGNYVPRGRGGSEFRIARGTMRAFPRGGPLRRPVAGPRLSRVGAGAGRGRSAFHGAPASVAQES